MIRIQDSPRVAVVIPLYNKGAYIARTLASVFSQTVVSTQGAEALEVCVVDDGSTDEGAAIVAQVIADRQAAGLNNLTLIQQTNQGPGAARNRGLAATTAPLIAFLDADDEWLPEFVAYCVGQLAAHPDCALCVTGQYRGPDRTSWLPRLKALGVRAGVWRLSQGLESIKMKPTLDLLHSGALVARRSVVDQFGGFYANHCTYGEDIYLWLQVMLNYPIYRDPEPMVWYHTECSELGVWNREHCPVWPMLLDPTAIRRSCPVEYRLLLEQYFAQYAILAARRLAQAGEQRQASQILKAFPLSNSFSSENLKANMDIFLANFPELRGWILRSRMVKR